MSRACPEIYNEELKFGLSKSPYPFPTQTSVDGLRLLISSFILSLSEAPLSILISQIWFSLVLTTLTQVQISRSSILYLITNMKRTHTLTESLVYGPLFPHWITILLSPPSNPSFTTFGTSSMLILDLAMYAPITSYVFVIKIFVTACKQAFW